MTCGLVQGAAVMIVLISSDPLMEEVGASREPWSPLGTRELELTSAVRVKHCPTTKRSTTINSKVDIVIFDFDSTVIAGESLEMVLDTVMKQDPESKEKLREISRITDLGMNGDISFGEALSRRLEIAAPSLSDVEAWCGEHNPGLLSEGFADLVQKLHDQKIKVYILSGGFADVIRPFAMRLGIPSERVFAVEIVWGQDGAFQAVDGRNLMSLSKLEGARKVREAWDGLFTVVVGDGYTDYQLWAGGIADEFIAYTEHVRRQKVVSVAERVVGNMQQLREILNLDNVEGQDGPTTGTC